MTDACHIATGTYTGDGSVDQGITGVGFQPKLVIINKRRTSDQAMDQHFANDADVSGGTFRHTADGGHSSVAAGAGARGILSLDSDGFSVTDGGVDGHPNTNGVVYTYVALG